MCLFLMYDILLKYIVMMEEHGQFLFIFMNFTISGIFSKIFVRVFFGEWYLLTFFSGFYFREKGKKNTKFAKINLGIN